MPAALQLVGQRFGMLVVVEFAGSNRHGKRTWKCRCDCETDAIAIGAELRSGHTVSCGCRQKSVRLNHGNCIGGKSPTYKSWEAMRRRCANPAVVGYENYGGRGITVCERWSSFDNFLADMGERPPGTTIDRVDTNGNYEPSNCRWATRKQQALTRRTTVLNETAVALIRYMHKRGATPRQLGHAFGVHYAYVSSVVSRRYWAA
jgi:hypothetical protein